MTPSPSLACTGADRAERQRLIADLLAGPGRQGLAALQAEIDRRLRPLDSPQQAIDALMPLLEARAAQLDELAARLRQLADVENGLSPARAAACETSQ